MRRFACTLMLLVAASPAGARSVLAQDVPSRVLERPDWTQDAPFTTITGLRELRDGRIIVSDAREVRLELLDPRSGAARTLARQGGGPGEFRTLTQLHALPGDSTLMFDAGNDRYLLITGDGAVSTPLVETADGSRFSESPIGLDMHGGLWFQRAQYASAEPRPGVAPSSTLVMRFDRRSKRVDTLAVLAIPGDRFQGARTLGGGMLQLIDNKPFAAEDIAAPAPDGRLAVVRARTFQVEWIAREGRRTAGPRIPYAPIRITDAEKRAHLRRQIRPGSIIVRPPAGGEGRVPPIGSSGSPPMPKSVDVGIDDPSITWPAAMPPFLAGAARVAPDGVLWVLRTRAHDDPRPAYDLFDQAGRRIARVVLPPDSRLVGFGAGAVYLARKDADDLEWLLKFRL